MSECCMVYLSLRRSLTGGVWLRQASSSSRGVTQRPMPSTNKLCLHLPVLSVPPSTSNRTPFDLGHTVLLHPWHATPLWTTARRPRPLPTMPPSSSPEACRHATQLREIRSERVRETCRAGQEGLQCCRVLYQEGPQAAGDVLRVQHHEYRWLNARKTRCLGRRKRAEETRLLVLRAGPKGGWHGARWALPCW